MRNWLVSFVDEFLKWEILKRLIMMWCLLIYDILLPHSGQNFSPPSKSQLHCGHLTSSFLFSTIASYPSLPDRIFPMMDLILSCSSPAS
jgi:hypothetical protein